MELLILPDQFIIKYSSQWTALLLLSGLILFFVSKRWRTQLKKQQKHSYFTSVLFTVSFIFLVGGINFFVYKIVMNKEGMILFNIKQFNHHILWSEMQRVEYQDNQTLVIFVNTSGLNAERIKLDLSRLDEASMDKVKILFKVKLKGGSG